MDIDKDEKQKKDEIMIKWVLGIVASMSVVFLVEMMNGMKSDATMHRQVMVNSQDIKELKDFKLKLIRIEVMSEMSLNKLNDLVLKVDKVSDLSTSNHSKQKANAIAIEGVKRLIKRNVMVNR